MNRFKKGIFLLFLFDFLACNRITEVQPANLGEAMARQVDKTFAGTDIGYAFMLMQNGQVIAQTSGGLKSRAIENQGALPFTIDTKMLTGSSTKTITALAFMKLTTQKNIKFTDKIIDYLPPTWRRGPNIDLITFGDLMTHGSGLRAVGATTCTPIYHWSGNSDGWANLKAVVEQGIQTSSYKQYCYYNGNTCLFRLLIPSILGYQFTGNDDIDNIKASALFLGYLQKEIFDKLAIKDVTGVANNNNSLTYLYEYPSANKKGVVDIVIPEYLGAGNLLLSMAEYCKLYHVVFGNKDGSVVSAEVANTMTDNSFGLFRDTFSVAQGTKIYYHRGIAYVVDCVGSATCYSQGCYALWFQLPDGTTCGLFVNAIDPAKVGIVPNTNRELYDYVLSIYNTGITQISK